MKPTTTRTKRRTELTGTKHIVRSLAVHAVFASVSVLQLQTQLTVPWLASVLSALAVKSTSKDETEKENASENTCELSPEDALVVTLLTHTPAFNVLAASNSLATFTKLVSKNSLFHLLKNPEWHYQIKFRGRMHAEVDGSPFNGALCFVRIDPDDSLHLETVVETASPSEPTELIEPTEPTESTDASDANENNEFGVLENNVDMDSIPSTTLSVPTTPSKPVKPKSAKPCRNTKQFGFCKNEAKGCPFNHNPTSIPASPSQQSRSDSTASSTTSSLPLSTKPDPPPQTPKKKPLAALPIKPNTINFLTLKSQVIALTITHLLQLLPRKKMNPLAQLARHIRETYYTTHFANSTPPPPYNLGTHPTDPEYDLSETTPTTTDDADEDLPKRLWPQHFHSWNLIRGLTAKQTFRRLLHEQYAPILHEDTYLLIDVVEDNSVREYPWTVVITPITDEDAVAACTRVSSRAAPILTALKALMDAAVISTPTTTEPDDATAEGFCPGSMLNDLNVNIVLVEMESRLEGSWAEVWKPLRSLVGDEKQKALKRRTVLKDSLVNEGTGERGGDVEDGDGEKEAESEEDVGDEKKVESLFDENVFAGFAEHVESLLTKISPPKAIQPHRIKFLANLQSIITRAFGQGYTAHLFGSSVTTLASQTSDADVTILLDDPTENPATHPISNMYLLASVLRHHGMQKVFPVATAKVPIVKFYDPVYNLHADVNVGNALGIENSRMIREYMQVDERVRDLILLIKYWAARRDLNDSAEGGTFSSYALTLMLISYLQLMNVLPSLQALYPDAEPRSYIIARTNTPLLKSTKSKIDAKTTAASLFTEYKTRLSNTTPTTPRPKTPPPDTSLDALFLSGKSIVSLTAQQIPTPLSPGLVLWDVSFLPSTSLPPTFTRRTFPAPYPRAEYYTSLTHLLHGFFHHYAHTHKFNSTCVISVRCGGTIPLSRAPGLSVRKGTKREGRQVVVVEDPFQLDRNTAGMVKEVGAVVGEFRRAAKAFEEGFGGGGGGLGFAGAFEKVFRQYNGDEEEDDGGKGKGKGKTGVV